MHATSSVRPHWKICCRSCAPRPTARRRAWKNAASASIAAGAVSTCDANKRYLTGALRVMMGSDHRLAIRKEILGPVAEEYGLTVAAVDSALRRLLETLDETGTQTWRDFRKEYGLERRKVTIGRLLYALESKLSQQ